MLAALYWGPRKETLQASLVCWHKTLVLMARAGLHNTVFGDDLQGVETTEDSPQTGYRYRWKSPGKYPEQLSLHVLCGAWAGASNAVLLDMPDKGAFSFERNTSGYLWAFSELIEVWDPLEGVVCRHEEMAWQDGRLNNTSPCIQRYRRDAPTTTGVFLDGRMGASVQDSNQSLN